MSKTKLLLSAAFAAIFLLTACETVPKSIPENLTPGEYFQRAQEEAGRQRYDSALLYYNTFIERYPEDVQKITEAEFEIAFIYYKKNDYSTAKTLFDNLLSKYEQPGAELLPNWPKILSEKLLITIDDKTSSELQK